MYSGEILLVLAQKDDTPRKGQLVMLCVLSCPSNLIFLVEFCFSLLHLTYLYPNLPSVLSAMIVNQNSEKVT